MKRFRFISYGCAPQSRKHYLNPACQTLKHIFVETDIKPGMFSPSIEKRLRQAKKHGTKIVLRRWRNVMVGVQVVNKEDHKIDMQKRNAKLKKLKKKLKGLVADPNVKSFITNIQKLGDVLYSTPYNSNLPLLLKEIK